MASRATPTADAATKRRRTPLRTKAKDWSWDIGQGQQVTYTQSPLTFVEKGEFTGLLARMLTKALDAGSMNFEQIGNLFTPGALESFRAGQLDVSELAGGFEGLVSLFLRVIAVVPEAISDTYALALHVPPQQVDNFKGLIRSTLPDEIGHGIRDLFIEQNADTLADFGRRWWETMSQAQQHFQTTTTSSEPSDDSPTSSE